MGKTKLIAVGNTVVAGMTPALRRVFHEISDLVVSLSQNNFVFYHTVGAKVAEVSNEAKAEKYGTEPVPRLAAAMGIDAGVLWSTMRLNRDYSLDEVKRLAGLKTRDGRAGVAWTHLVHLLTINDRSVRDKLIDQVVGEGLTVKELLAEIQRRFGTRGRGGRPMTRPRTPFACLQQIAQISSTLVSRHEDVWSDALVEIGRLPPDNYTPEFLAQLDEALEQQERVADVTGKDVKKLRELRERIAEIVEAKKKKGK